MSNITILASTNILKCKFCDFDEDDPDRWVTVGDGEIQDPYHELEYDKATGTLREPTINSRYAYVECPNLKCARYYVEENFYEDNEKSEFISLEDMLVRVSETEDRFLQQFPLSSSINVKKMVEYGTVICSHCGFYNKQDNSEKEFSIVYAPGILKQPAIMISCKSHQCEGIYPMKKPGKHYSQFVQLKDSRILQTLAVTVEPLENLETYDPVELRRKLHKLVEQLRSRPETIQDNILRVYLETLTGKKVEVV